MTEQHTSKRASFPVGEQKQFLDAVLEKISLQEAAKICGLSERTIRDWRREKFSMDSDAFDILSRKTKMLFPTNVELKERYWYTTKGGHAGGKAIVAKYGRVGGEPENRKKKWFEWWAREGQYKPNSILVSKKIREPAYSEKLAELVGILLGDGGISDYQVTVTLHAVDDKEYGDFVTTLIKELFEVPVGIHRSKRAAVFNYVVSRTGLVLFLEKIGLKRGNKVKHQVDIPDWIKRNREYSIACVRGLVDTDGCVFTHRYKVKGKPYAYKKLLFTSRSEPLRQSVFSILQNLGIRVRLDNGYDARIDSKEHMEKYFQIVGSHNPKHLKRYKK